MTAAVRTSGYVRVYVCLGSILRARLKAVEHQPQNFVSSHIELLFTFSEFQAWLFLQATNSEWKRQKGRGDGRGMGGETIRCFVCYFQQYMLGHVCEKIFVKCSSFFDPISSYAYFLKS